MDLPCECKLFSNSLERLQIPSDLCNPCDVRGSNLLTRLDAYRLGPDSPSPTGSVPLDLSSIPVIMIQGWVEHGGLPCETQRDPESTGWVAHHGHYQGFYNTFRHLPAVLLPIYTDVASCKWSCSVIMISLLLAGTCAECSEVP